MASFPGGYPAARRLDLVEDLHGYRVADPYRWLEDADSAQTRQWLAAEEELWAGYRAGLPRREAFAARVRELLRVGSVGLPTWRGSTRFSHAPRPGPGARGPLRRRRARAGRHGRALIDPVAIDASGRTTLDAWAPDKEGRLLAYQLSHGGDEESVLRVIDVATGELVDGPIDRCRYSGVTWLPGGKAFYYVRRLPPEAVPEGESQYHRRVYLHVVGTPPEADAEVFGAGRGQDHVLRDQRQPGRALADRLVVGGDRAAGGHLDRRPDVVRPGGAGARAAHGGAGRDGLAAGRAGRASSTCSPTWTRRAAGSASPTRQRRDPRAGGTSSREDPAAVLRSYAILDGPELARPVLVVSRTRHAVSEVSVHDLATGEFLRALELPGIGTVGGVGERPEGGHEAWFGYTDYTTPAVVLRYDAAAGALDTWAASPGGRAFRGGNPPAVTASQVTYRSKDGTEVRMVVIKPAGTPEAERRNGPASSTGTAASTSARPPATRRTSSPGSRRAACTRSPGCAAAARRARSGTAPGCLTASRTCSTTSTPRPST